MSKRKLRWYNAYYAAMGLCSGTTARQTRRVGRPSPFLHAVAAVRRAARVVAETVAKADCCRVRCETIVPGAVLTGARRRGYGWSDPGARTRRRRGKGALAGGHTRA